MDPTRLAVLFAYDHLSEALQAVSKPFADHAQVLLNSYPADRAPATREAALWKLWEAKNLAVIAAAQQLAP